MISPGTRACLFNSFNFDVERLELLARRVPGVRMVHRVGAVTSLYRGYDDGTDARHGRGQCAARATRRSRSRSATIEMYRSIGIELVEPRVIHNALDPEIFHPDGRVAVLPRPSDPPDLVELVRQPAQGRADLPLARGAARLGPVRVHVRRQHRRRCSSGSGTCRRLPRPSSRRRSGRHDVFVTATEHDAYSNALVEALSCGLPALYLDSGGSRRGRQGGGLRVSGARGDPGAARPARRRVRGAAGADLAADASRRSRTRTSRRSGWTSSFGAMATSALRDTARPLARRVASVLTRRWPPHSHLFLVGEGAGWVIDHELRALGDTARSLGVPVADRRLLRGSSGAGRVLRQPVHAARRRVEPAAAPARRGLLPRPPGDARDARVRRLLPARSASTTRSSTACSCRTARSRRVVLGSGIDPGKVFRIPIGIEPSYFQPQTPRAARARRARSWGCPRTRFVVGSFQKDGVGFGDGLEPKAIKGPDVLLEALGLLRERGRRPARPPRGAGARIRPRGARAARHSVSPPRTRALRGDRAALPGARRLRRPVAAGGRAEGRARGDGERRPRRDDARRPGDGPRPQRRERVAGRGRRRRGPRGWLAHVAATSRGAGARWSRPAWRPRRRTRTRRSARSGASFFEGFVEASLSDWRSSVPWSVRAPVRRTRNAIASGLLAVRERPRRRAYRRHLAEARRARGLLRRRRACRGPMRS